MLSAWSWNSTTETHLPKTRIRQGPPVTYKIFSFKWSCLATEMDGKSVYFWFVEIEERETREHRISKWVLLLLLRVWALRNAMKGRMLWIACPRLWNFMLYIKDSVRRPQKFEKIFLLHLTLLSKRPIHSDEERRLMFDCHPQPSHHLPFDQGVQIVISPSSVVYVPELIKVI